MTDKAKALLAAAVACISIAAAPLASLAVTGGSAAIELACNGGGGTGGCAG